MLPCALFYVDENERIVPTRYMVREINMSGSILSSVIQTKLGREEIFRDGPQTLSDITKEG